MGSDLRLNLRDDSTPSTAKRACPHCGAHSFDEERLGGMTPGRAYACDSCGEMAGLTGSSTAATVLAVCVGGALGTVLGALVAGNGLAWALGIVGAFAGQLLFPSKPAELTRHSGRK